MPRVNYVKKARKDNPVCKAGESYYWWKFRYGGKRYSLTPPKRSQLTQSEYFGRLYDLDDRVTSFESEDWDDVYALMEEVGDELQEIADECQEKLDNMPDQLQYAPTGELLQERLDACSSAADEVESLDEFDEDEPLEHEYEDECPECNGTGMIDNPDYDEDEDGDEDQEVLCDNCNGDGAVLDETAFEQEIADWEERRREHISNAKSELSDLISNCFV